MTPEMRALEARLEIAHEVLRRLTEGATNPRERTRLLGKMEGVALALSYLREADQPEADVPDRAEKIKQGINDFIDNPLGPT